MERKVRLRRIPALRHQQRLQPLRAWFQQWGLKMSGFTVNLTIRQEWCYVNVGGEPENISYSDFLILRES